MCEHLAQLEQVLLDRGIPVTFRGQPWTTNCREWVYFDCYLDLELIRRRLRLAPCVHDHINLDTKSGEERGFVCTEHHDAVMGVPHPSDRCPIVT
jgi:hypothetical protein